MSTNAHAEIHEKASPNTSADGIASPELAGALGATPSNPERVKEASAAADPKPRLARFVRHPLLAPVESEDPFLDFPTATSEKVSSITGSAANLTTITTNTNINDLESNGKQSNISHTSTTFRTPTISSPAQSPKRPLQRLKMLHWLPFMKKKVFSRPRNIHILRLLMDINAVNL